MDDKQSQPRIVVIGAGVGGLMFGAGLRRKIPGFDNFIIYEKANDLAGTWRSNTFPGCSSDVPSHFFSLSTDLNPDWDYTHAKQSQFLEYWKNIALKYELYPHLVFNTEVTSAVWDPEKSKYIIKKRAVKDDYLSVKPPGAQQVEEDTTEEEQDEADILISALGILEVINYPNIPGLETFKGDIFHSGAWNHRVDLRGKRVGVVGNGASATQLIPVISEDPQVSVTNFCRTPNWVLPPIRSEIGPVMKWIFRNVPLFMRLHRICLYVNTDLFYGMVFANAWTRSFTNNLTRMTLKKYILDTAPKKYHDKLIPSYTLGCKRVIFDTDYLKSLHRPNVDMNWDGIQSITEDGVITKTGDKLPFDVLIFATGFVADDYSLYVKGTRETVKEFYDKNGGPTAYMGTTLPGFPNFYMIAGPNTTTGHTSVIFTEECQVDYMIQLIKPVLDGDLKTVEVTDHANKRYNDNIQSRLRKSVFVDCVSWYRKNSDGKVTSIFPGMSTLFWWWFRRPKWSDYNVSARKPEEWKRKQRRQAWVRFLKKFAWIVSVLVAVVMIRAKRAGKWDDLVQDVKHLLAPVLTTVNDYYYRTTSLLTSLK
ncbi:FAD/NAD(P)-binding domain-containing protein [Marasmius fiardii PR-910]|nr:FAD/NAD(P)-binding domain-containing protein [Marasmius fiardii PR-910]